MVSHHIRLILANGSFWIPAIFGFLFLTLPVPNKKQVSDYKRINIIISAIYLFYALISLIALMVNKDLNYDKTIRLFIPLISVFHIVLFSHSNILLINKPSYRSKMFRNWLAIGIIASFIYLAIYFNSDTAAINKYAYHSMHLLMLTLTVYYSFHFFKHYKKFEAALYNFYSEASHNHLKWVNSSQVLVLIIAGFAFLTAWLPDYTMLGFLALTLIFYVYYAFRLINYNFTSVYIANYIGESDLFLETEEDVEESKEDDVKSLSFSEIEDALEMWVTEKKYLEADRTIISVANELNTNRTYLSNYINNYENKTFKEWISELRIEEAKKMLIEKPHMSINDISVSVGFTDRSNFGRNFLKMTGHTPSAWRTMHKKIVTN